MASARLLLACLLLACQGATARVEKALYTEYKELTFDRSLDLIPPEGLRITATEERQIALAWEPVLVGDVAGYAVLRARDPAGTHLLVGQTRSRFASVYIDQGSGPERLGDGQTYSYRIHPFDSLGRVSRSHARISASTDPRPAPPTGLRSYSNLPRKVALAWEPSPSPAVVGYAIYRSPTPSGQWNRVGFADGRLNTVWEDPVNGDLRLMYYRLEAVNRFNASSDPSTPVRAVTKAEPLPPVGLEIRASTLGRVELTWSQNVEDDLDRYEIWRADAIDSKVGAGGGFGPERRIGEVPAAQLGFADQGVACAASVRYRLRAIDRDRLQSGFSKPLIGRAGDMGLTLDRTTGVAQLRWDPELRAPWPAARIAEVRGALPARVLATVIDTARYDLSELAPGPHTLRVTLLSSTGDTEPPPREAPPCDLRVELSAPGS